MISRLQTLSERFLALENHVYESSQRPPLDRITNGDFGASPRIIGFTNPFSFQILCRRPDLVEAADHWYSDGSLLCRTVGWGRGGPLPRYSFDFSSIADGVFDYAQHNGIAVALLGGTEDEITSASAYLRGRYPGLTLVWTRSGYFRKERQSDGGRAEALDALVASGAQMVIIGMGTPLQEDVAVEIKQRMLTTGKRAGVIFTCGGFLSQTAHGGDYYPELIKRFGLRWVYRAFRERHVRQRLIRDYPRFAAQMIACKLYRLSFPKL